MPIGGSKGATTNKTWDTQTASGQTGLDAQTEQWRREMMGAAQAAGNGNPLMNQGIGAMTGGANPFMNPYQQQVIDRMNDQFGVQNQMTMRGVNDAATQANAFGGSRHGIATGTALAENARNQSAQVANLLQQGYGDSMNRAQWAAEQGSQGLGDPNAYRLNMMGRAFQGFGGLHGTTNSGTSGQSRSGWNAGLNFGFGGG